MRTTVLRAEFNANGYDEYRYTQTGCLWYDLDEGEELEPDATIVWYALARQHLLEILAHARAGGTDDEILLALDAAALNDDPGDE